MTTDTFRVVSRTDDIPQGKTLCISTNAGEVLICHTNEGFYAVDNLCTHAAARMSEGKLKGCRILCPLHGAAFDVRDGSVLSKPAREGLRSYPVKVENGDVLLGGIS